MSDPLPRTHSPDFIREVTERLAAGEAISALSAELGVGRQLLYRWRVAALRGEDPRPLPARRRKVDPTSSTGDAEQTLRRTPRRFSRDFKRSAIERIVSGERVRALSSELGVGRQLLYRWYAAARAGVEPRPPGRPLKTISTPNSPPVSSSNDLEAARKRIAELERKVSQQSRWIDYYKGVLRHIETSRRAMRKLG